MAKKVRIRLPGGNDFYEKIKAPTRKQAIEIAKARYPGYQHVSCVTECWSDEEEESNRQFHRDLDRREKEHDGDFWTNSEFGNPVGSSGGVSDGSSSSSSGGSITDAVASLGIIGFMIALGVVVILFPIFLGWLTMKGTNAIKDRVFSPHFVLSFIIGLSASPTSCN